MCWKLDFKSLHEKCVWPWLVTDIGDNGLHNLHVITRSSLLCEIAEGCELG